LNTAGSSSRSCKLLNTKISEKRGRTGSLPKTKVKVEHPGEDSNFSLSASPPFLLLPGPQSSKGAGASPREDVGAPFPGDRKEASWF